MKIFELILITSILILSKHSYSQNKICGKVIDSITKKPVAYATISTVSGATYCDSLGNFEFLNSLDEEISISCVSYTTKQFIIKKNYCDTFFLSPTANELNPVIVGDYYWLRNKKTEVGRLQGKSLFAINVPSGLTFLKYFNSPDSNRTYIISEFKVRVSQSKDFEPRKVRVRIFNAKNPYTIGEDIFPVSNVYILEKVDENFITINLNQFAIEMPNSGCFIGFEFIGNGFDNDMNKKNNRGFITIKGWLAKTYEDGTVVTKYFSNDFNEATFPPSRKSNIYAAITLYEKNKN